MKIRSTMNLRRAAFVSCFPLLALACGGNRAESPTPAAATPTSSLAPSASVDPTDAALASVKQVHGGAGPWAVAGYRMGEYALRELGLSRGSFDLAIVHFTPREVQYSCVADGAAAATGASLGKLNLTLADASAAGTRTTYRRKSTGKEITLRPAPSFAARFANIPRERLGEAGREVLSLRDEEIFEVVAF